MIESWKIYLQSQGAHFEGDTVQHFGNPGAELAAAKNGSIVADLSLDKEMLQDVIR